MSDEKTLEEALDEFDRWGNRVIEAVESLSPEEVVEYFEQSQSRLEQRTGKRFKLPLRASPSTTVS
jgi:hypothetical protein